MGKRGPKPTPTHIKQQRGSRRAGENPAEPQVPRGYPPKPAEIEPDVSAWWDHYAEMLYSAGLLTPLDGTNLLRLAQATAEVQWCNRVLGRKIIVNTKKRTKAATGESSPPEEFEIRYIQVHPLYYVRKDALAQEAKILACFGMSPADRVRVEAIPVASQKPALPAGEIQLLD